MVAKGNVDNVCITPDFWQSDCETITKINKGICTTLQALPRPPFHLVFVSRQVLCAYGLCIKKIKMDTRWNCPLEQQKIRTQDCSVSKQNCLVLFKIHIWMDSGAVIEINDCFLKRQAAARVENEHFTNDPFHQQVLFFVWSKHDFIFPFAEQGWLGEFLRPRKCIFSTILYSSLWKMSQLIVQLSCHRNQNQ